MASLNHGEQGVNRQPTMPSACLINGFGGAGKGNASRPVSRVLSMRVAPHWMTIHLERPLPDASRNLPGRRGRKRPWRPKPPRCPYSVLLPVGFALPPPLPGARCALAAPFHPCARPLEPGPRYSFCGTFPGVAPAGRYPAPCFHGARTFLPRALSGLAAAVIQPAGG